MARGKRRYGQFSKVKRGELKNKSEIAVFKQLKECAGKSYTVSYETEEIAYTTSHNYVPDFILAFKDGRKLYIEAKGWLDNESRTKMRCVKRDNPDLDIRFLFYKDKLVYKNGKMMYSDWAEKYNFPYCIGTVPKDWLT